MHSKIPTFSIGEGIAKKGKTERQKSERVKAASKRGAKWKPKDSSTCAVLVKRIVEFHVRSNKTYVYWRYRSACEKYKGMRER